MPAQGGAQTHIGVVLNPRPRRGSARMLRLDTDRVGVPPDTGPAPRTRVVGDTGGDDIDDAGAAKTQLGERTFQVGAAVTDDPKRRVVALGGCGRGGVVGDDAGDRPGELPASILPAVDLDDLEAGVADDLREPE